MLQKMQPVNERKSFRITQARDVVCLHYSYLAVYVSIHYQSLKSENNTYMNLPEVTAF